MAGRVLGEQLKYAITLILLCSSLVCTVMI